ncbi:winged helix-turn-helix transcriptional regulator [Streptomyces liangshanensis]|uniref:Helix-turn-helix transcriptional regulator n=1 Tax=Streptomyces liangshanensis TaxID=2717324 RepID=A0A6G9GUQ2_9ACTN|nr:helix-turn-helix domain-containing protein [Streptomyces liangshanensis]QIQ01930.1 helix-turn-helix transcriptional regulator [Streptomyces liangshanensis]
MDDLSKSPDAQALANCPVSRTLEVVGTRSTLLLMREAFFGTRRFQDFTRRVGIGEAATAARLKEMTAYGLLEKIPYQEPGQRKRYEYRLTAKGQDLFAAITSLRDWGETWTPDDGHGPTPWRFTHQDCGAEVHTVTRCSAGHDVHAGDCTAVREPERALGGRVS